LDADKLLTMAMCEIWTQAHPTLKRPGSVTYQTWRWVSDRWSKIKSGFVKMPMKQGITKRVPKMYHGILDPQRVLILSLRTPTKGVVMPSQIYPESVAAAVICGERSMTSLRYQER
jgi:hypothetical protein